MTTVEDPVCGMSFAEEEAEALGAETVEHDGDTVYLCSPTCREEFEAEPDAYLG